ncbi:MAG TPA: Ig-like domain-containing protein [Thermoanaerobaculia bacterium]|nr:Ig-like domain-containing protein [Thermoanaerobaculia bacterium]
MHHMTFTHSPLRSRFALSAAAAVALALVAGPAAASTKFGTVRSPANNPCTDAEPVSSALGDPFGVVDGIGPSGGNVASNKVTVLGWALDDDGIAAVDILVDGHEAGRARLQRARPDVALIFPEFPGAALSGFDFELDTTRWQNGEHVVTAQVISNTGQLAVLSGIVLDFQNSTHNLKPFGEIDFPDQNAAWPGTCNPLSAQRRLNVVTGWALDLGVEINDHGIGYVELMIDGSIVANSRRDCRNSVATGLNTNCYGVFRQDVEQRYPTAKDAANAGFRFVVDVGALITDFGFAEGNHVLTVRAGDQDSQVNNIDSVNVKFICSGIFGNSPAIGSIDPPPAERNSGVIQLTGWALDEDGGVSSVTILIDGVSVGQAVYGFPRPEVTQRHPGFPDSGAPGWAFTLDTRLFSDGLHSVQLLVNDEEGNTQLVGEIDLFIDNR